MGLLLFLKFNLLLLALNGVWGSVSDNKYTDISRVCKHFLQTNIMRFFTPVDKMEKVKQIGWTFKMVISKY